MVVAGVELEAGMGVARVKGLGAGAGVCGTDGAGV